MINWITSVTILAIIVVLTYITKGGFLLFLVVGLLCAVLAYLLKITLDEVFGKH